MIFGHLQSTHLQSLPQEQAQHVVATTFASASASASALLATTGTTAAGVVEAVVVFGSQLHSVTHTHFPPVVH